jgi:hypothetical protein
MNEPNLGGYIAQVCDGPTKLLGSVGPEIKIKAQRIMSAIKEVFKSVF